MPKFRNNRYGASMNLQLFAEGGDTEADAGDGDDPRTIPKMVRTKAGKTNQSTHRQISTKQ